MINLKQSKAAARKWLAGTWIFFALINFGILFYLYFSKQLESDNLEVALSQLNMCYAPFLGAILSFLWSDKRKNETTKSGKASFIVAMIFSVFWNFLILILFLKLLFQNGFIEESIQSIRVINNYLVWFVAGAIGYYFGRS